MTIVDACAAPGRDALQSSVVKALALLDVFEGASVLGVSEVARRAGLAKTTAYRLLSSLESQGFVERRDVHYCLGRRLFELGNQVSWCRPRSLRDTALPILCDLYGSTRRTVHLGVLDDVDVLLIDKLEGREKPCPPTRVGGRIPARTSALGKAMLAFAEAADISAALDSSPPPQTPYSITSASVFTSELEDVRRNGVAFEREEAYLGLVSVAAPILRRGRAIGAVSVTGPSGVFEPDRCAGKVRAAASAIAVEMTSRA